MQKIKVGDIVEVTAGKFKKTVGNVAKIKILKNNQVAYSVEGVKMKKTQKADPQREKAASIIEIYRPIHGSNVKLYDSEAKKSSRVGIKLDENGKKYRFYKKTGNALKAEQDS